MADFLLFIGLLFTFFYLKSRINGLEERIGREEKRSFTPPAVLQEADKFKTMGEVLRESAPVSSAQNEPDLPVPSPVATRTVPEKKDDDLEFKFGSKIFTAVGAIAIIFAVGFFLRYAFESGLINEKARVFLGVLAGTVLLTIGELTRKKFASYGQVVTGSGLGVLYLSFYAAFNFYHMIGQPLAFAAMSAVTVAGILLALRYDSMALACFAQFGGLITPLMVSAGEANPHILFPYLLMLDLGAAFVSYKKLWRGLTLESFLGTAFLYWSWLLVSYDQTQFATAAFYSSLFFLVFLAISFMQNSGRKSVQDSFDLGLTTANPGFYFLAGYTIINQKYPDAAGFFTFLLAFFYLLLAFTAGTKERTSDLFHRFLIAIGVVLAVIAVPVQFHESWITIGWAAEAAALTYLGFKLRFPFVRMVGQCAFFFSIFRLFLFERDLPPDAPAFLNVRFLIFFAVFAALLFAAYIYRRRRAETGTDETVIFSVLLVEALVVIVSILSLEIHSFFQPFWFPIAWSAVGLLAAWAALKVKDAPLLWSSYALFFIIFFRLIFFESRVNIADYSPLFNGRFLAFVFSAAAIRTLLYLIRRQDGVTGESYATAKPVLFSVFHFLLIWVASAEVLDFFNQQIYQLNSQQKNARLDYFANVKNVSLSVLWAFYGIALSVAGIIKKSAYERFFAIILLGVVVLKVFLFDTSNLNNFYRSVSFVTLGCILLAAGYLYYRFRDRISKFVQGK